MEFCSMESVESLIKTLRKAKKLREENAEKAEKEQAEEYNELMRRLQSLKDERTKTTDTIVKNLSTLTAHKHSVHKMINDKDSAVLPISHDCQQEAITFFSDAIDFINNFQNVYKALDNGNNESSLDPAKITDDVVSCTLSVGNEIYRVKSSILQVETLRSNIENLQERCFVPTDEELSDTNFDGSIF